MNAAGVLADLEQALQAERQALLANDAEALLQSTHTKLAAVRALQGLPADAVAPERVRALGELNQANHVLLSRRRREVAWALRHLGRVESAGVYDALGQSGARPQARCLGVG
ncbi:MAG: flagellar protein FlgN [Lysobacter sp.]|nr:flagellar protein FlgN [Lysobacter sp.]